MAGWDLHPLEKRRLTTAHTHSGHWQRAFGLVVIAIWQSWPTSKSSMYCYINLVLPSRIYAETSRTLRLFGSLVRIAFRLGDGAKKRIDSPTNRAALANFCFIMLRFIDRGFSLNIK